MKKVMVRTLVASALVWGAVSSAAIADEPIELTDAQMDIVTAGQVGTTPNVVARAIGGAGGAGGAGARRAAGATPAPAAGQVVEAWAAVAAPAAVAAAAKAAAGGPEAWPWADLAAWEDPADPAAPPLPRQSG